MIEALVLDIGDNQMLLGLDWLAVHNPDVDWKKGSVMLNRCPKKCRSFNRKIKRSTEVKSDKDENGLSKGIMPSYIKKDYAHLFEKKKFDKLPRRREWDHGIELLPDAPKSIVARNYRMTLDEQKALDEFLTEELKAGKIRPSKSPYASPCFFNLKNDKTRRLVQDYRKINAWTVKDKTPLPRIDDLMDVLTENKFFTKMDIIWGYNNVRIKQGDEHLAAFQTPRGLFEPTVMYFGLCNSPGTFSQMMASLFKDMIAQKKCVIYMDDIVFIGKTLKELERNTLEGIKILDKHELYVMESKCYWEVEEVPILG